MAERQDYKVELIDDLVAGADPAHPLETVSLYTNGPFTDLCRGPHAPSTKSVGAFKLQSVAGAYWRGDSTRTMLTRIYGTAFFSKAELSEHLERIEQAKARDHRKLGRELELFTFSEVSPGAAFWLPAGTSVWNALVAVLARDGREARLHRGEDAAHLRRRAVEDLRALGQVQENMFTVTVEEREMGVKPMNCPGHVQLFNDAAPLLPRPARALLRAGPAAPQRAPRACCTGCCECATSPRTTRHIFCTEEQVQEEVKGCLEMAFATYKLFDFDVRLELSTRPEQRIGTDEMWDRAEGNADERAATSRAWSYELNPGDGAFYGPKIDMHMTDSLGRSWQLGTVQLDYSMPERFELSYTGADNQEHRPVMIHRALFGSYERFIGIMLEHYAGRAAAVADAGAGDRAAGLRSLQRVRARR